MRAPPAGHGVCSHQEGEMGLGEVVRRVFKPWAVLLLGLLLTGIATTAAVSQYPNQYQATARLMLLLPPESERPSVNPFLDQRNGLVVLASVVSEIPYSSGAHNELTELGLESQFEVGLDPSTPVITVSVEGTDADDVTATRDWIVQRMETELLQVQQEEGAPGRHFASTRVFMAEAVPHTIGGDPTRALIGALVSGGLLSCLAAMLVARTIRGMPRHRAPEGVST